MYVVVKMRNNNTVETVNAAAAAIVTAEARVQPPTSLLHKKRWRSFWNLHSCCFGFFHRNNKRIGHAVLVPEPTTTSGPASSASNYQPPPPSSPAFQSDPPSISQSPTKLLSLASLSAQANSDSASIFTIGPYAYETQLVSPPVFSAFTTEPSTAAFTPPPEPSTTASFTTTPPSPDVPFAQLLASSLERARRNGGPNNKFTLLSLGEFLPYQVISPGSGASGASTPFRPRSDHFPARKLGSRVGSGTLTPDGIGVRSRLGSGSLTPDGAGFRSRLGSGCLTPDGAKTPSGQESVTVDDPIAEALSVFNSDKGSKHGNVENVIEHRVSFELTGEDVARCLENKSSASFREFPEDFVDERHSDRNRCEFCHKESTNQKAGNEICCQKHHLVKFGSGREFKFDSASNGEVSSNTRTGSSWSFFPLLQPEVS